MEEEPIPKGPNSASDQGDPDSRERGRRGKDRGKNKGNDLFLGPRGEEKSGNLLVFNKQPD